MSRVNKSMMQKSQTNNTFADKRMQKQWKSRYGSTDRGSRPTSPLTRPKSANLNATRSSLQQRREFSQSLKQVALKIHESGG